jgi:hypothetical protein
MAIVSRRRFPSLLAVAALALVVQLVSVVGPVAAAVPPSTFEAGDGNLTPAGGTDWANVGPVSVGTDRTSHAGDNSFKRGSKENDACGFITTHPVPPNKADIIRFYVAGEAVAGQNFAYVAWVRDDAHGDVNFTVEFNQSKLFCPNGVQPQKTIGDILFEFQIHPGSFNGSPGTVVPQIRRWEGSRWSGPSPLGPIAEGSINSQGPVIDPIAGTTLDTSDFGELSINLTAAADGRCFNNAVIKSRASRSFTAALKDFAGGVPISVGACTPPPPPPVCNWYFRDVPVGTRFGVGDTHLGGTFTFIENNNQMHVRQEPTGDIVGRFLQIANGDRATITFAAPIKISQILWHDNDPNPLDPSQIGWTFTTDTQTIVGPITGQRQTIITPVLLSTTTITIDAGNESGGIDICFVPA